MMRDLSQNDMVVYRLLSRCLHNKYCFSDFPRCFTSFSMIMASHSSVFSEDAPAPGNS